MKFEEILEGIRQLGCSQGAYGRMYASIMALSEEDKAELKKQLEAQNFKDMVDFVMFIEQ